MFAESFRRRCETLRGSSSFSSGSGRGRSRGTSRVVRRRSRVVLVVQGPRECMRSRGRGEMEWVPRHGEPPRPYTQTWDSCLQRDILSSCLCFVLRRLPSFGPSSEFSFNLHHRPPPLSVRRKRRWCRSTRPGWNRSTVTGVHSLTGPTTPHLPRE